MDLKVREVVVFRFNEYLMSLTPNQDESKIRSYDRKTARVLSKVEEVQTRGIFYNIKFPDGFVLREISASHLHPILASKYKGNFRR